MRIKNRFFFFSGGGGGECGWSEGEMGFDMVHL